MGPEENIRREITITNKNSFIDNLGTDWGTRHANVIRSMIFHENELRNHRMSWFLILQGLMWASFAILYKGLWPDEDCRIGMASETEALVTLIGIVGSSIAFCFLILFEFGDRAVHQLRAAFITKVAPEYVGYDVVGFRGSSLFWRGFHPWIFIPCTFFFTWIAVIIVVNVRISDENVLWWAVTGGTFVVIMLCSIIFAHFTKPEEVEEKEKGKKSYWLQV